MKYLICHDISISHFSTCVPFRWSIFTTTKLLPLVSTTFALLATTPKRPAILGWASSATLCSTGKSNPLLSAASTNALQYRSEITNRCLEMGFGRVPAKVSVLIGLFKKPLLTINTKCQELHYKVEMIHWFRINETLQMYKSKHTISKNCHLCFKLTYFSLLFQHAFCGIFQFVECYRFSDSTVYEIRSKYFSSYDILKKKEKRVIEVIFIATHREK